MSKYDKGPENNSINENMKEDQKMIKYLLIEVTEDNEEILNHIPDNKIIDECTMSEEEADRMGCPVIYKLRNGLYHY